MNVDKTVTITLTKNEAEILDWALALGKAEAYRGVRENKHVAGFEPRSLAKMAQFYDNLQEAL
jgi:hypothetical protein